MLVSTIAAALILDGIKLCRQENPRNTSFSCGIITKEVVNPDKRQYVEQELSNAADIYCAKYLKQFEAVGCAPRSHAFVNAIATFKEGIVYRDRVLSNDHKAVQVERERWLAWLEKREVGHLVDAAARVLLVSSKRRHTRQDFKSLINDFAPGHADAVFDACKLDKRFNFTSTGKHAHYVSYKGALS